MSYPYASATIINQDAFFSHRDNFPGAHVIITFKQEDITQPVCCLNPAKKRACLRACYRLDYLLLHKTLFQ